MKRDVDEVDEVEAIDGIEDFSKRDTQQFGPGWPWGGGGGWCGWGWYWDPYWRRCRRRWWDGGHRGWKRDVDNADDPAVAAATMAGADIMMVPRRWLGRTS